MKEMKFKPEYLAKHLNSDLNKISQRKIIVTTRAECPYKYGDLFWISGLENPFVFASTESYEGFDEYFNEFCLKHERETGFDAQELLDVIKGLYPNAEELHAIWLYECFM